MTDVQDLAAMLRDRPVPIVCRIERDTLVVDVRTIAPEDEDTLLAGLVMVLS